MEKAPEGPVGAAQSVYRRGFCHWLGASTFHNTFLPSPSPHPTFWLKGHSTDLVFIQEGQVHVNILHCPVMPFKLHHCLLHSGVARRGAGEQKHKKDFKFKSVTAFSKSDAREGNGLLTHLRVDCAPPHHQAIALSGAGLQDTVPWMNQVWLQAGSLLRRLFWTSVSLLQGTVRSFGWQQSWRLTAYYSHKFLDLETHMGFHGHFENQTCSFCSFILHQGVLSVSLSLFPSSHSSVGCQD